MLFFIFTSVMVTRSAFISTLFMLIFVACASNQDESEYKVLHYNQPNAITSLDPAFAKSQNNIWAVEHIFDGLVCLDSTLKVVPSIAKSWEISNNGLEYTFHLRNDVFFHEDACFANKSRKVVAADCEYSFNRLIDTEVNSPGAWLFSDKVDTLQPFRALNDSTFQIKLLTPFRPFLGILSMQYCSIVPKEALDYYREGFRTHPVGTGPFMFKKWLENQALFLSRNEKYYLGPSQLEGVRTSFIADRKIAFLELMKGNIELNSGLESSFVNELLTKDGNLKEEMKEKVKYIKSPYLNMEYLGINMELAKTSKLNAKKVRQALNYAINRPLMLKALRNNVGVPANAGFIPRGLPSHNSTVVKGYNYDLEKARALLQEAGFPKGNGLDPLTIYTNSDYIDLCTFIAKEWEKIGLRVEIELMESAVLRAGMRKSSIPLFRGSWIADYPDGESFLCMFYSKNPAPPNYTRFENKAFDQLYERAIQENNDSLRIDLYQQMDKILVDEAPVVFLFYDESSIFTTPNIENLERNALNQLKAYPLKHH